MFYAEQKTPTSGDWQPVIFHSEVTLDRNMRVKQSEGLGARLRFQPVRIAEAHRETELTALQAIYGVGQ